MKFDLFISYSRKDFDEVNSIKEYIERAIPGISIWFDLTGIESGDEFEDKIVSAINSSQNILFMLSKNSLLSQWTKKEVIYADNIKKKIVPILLKEAQVEDWFLFRFGQTDSITIDDSKQAEKLIKNLSLWTGKTINEKSSQIDPYDNDTNRRNANSKNQLNAQALGMSEKVFSMYQLAKDGDASAQYNLSIAYKNGDGVSLNPDKWMYWCIKAANNKHTIAMIALIKYYNLKHQHKDEQFWSEKAYTELKELAENGDSEAMYNLGKIMDDDSLYIRNQFDEAPRFISEAAKHNHPEALFMMARYYYGYREIFERDEFKGGIYLLKAQKYGSKYAKDETDWLKKVSDIIDMNYSYDNTKRVYKVILIASGSNKLHTASVIKELLNMNLHEAKRLTNSNDSLLTIADEDDANRIKKRIESKGGIVKLSECTPKKDDPVYSVILKMANKNRINIMSVIKDLLYLDLSIVKKLVDNTPSILVTTYKPYTQLIKMKIESVGGIVEIC